MARLTVDPPHVQAAAQSAVDGLRGVDAIASYWTEVSLPATGTWNAPGKGGESVYRAGPGCQASAKLVGAVTLTRGRLR